MKLKLKKISDLSGNKASIYTITVDTDMHSLFEKFILENKNSHLSEIQDILARLKTIGKKTGAREIYFKMNEGVPGDGVVALFDQPNKKLRLYCIRYGTQIIILGGGAQKDKNIRALQENENLRKENYLIRAISNSITKRLNDEIFFSPNGLELTGTLQIDIEDFNIK